MAAKLVFAVLIKNCPYLQVSKMGKIEHYGRKGSCNYLV